MRILPGNSKINILSDDQDNSDFILLAELVDSTMGYEKPTLIKNSRDLLIWFGDDFKDYMYLKELLDRGRVSLYLYRGVETEGTGKTISSDYYYIPDITPNTHETLIALRGGDENDTSSFIDHYLPTPTTDEEKETLYKVILTNGNNYDSTFGIRYSYYIYNEYYDTFVLYDSLDESKKIKSLQNRDRLSVGYYQSNGGEDRIITYSYYHPGMDYESNIDPTRKLVEIENFNEFQEKILSGHITRNLVASGKNITEESLRGDKYIPLRDLADDGTECDLPIVEDNTNITYFFAWPSDINTSLVEPEESIVDHDTTYYCLEPKNYNFTTLRRRYGLAVENFSGYYQLAFLGGVGYNVQNGTGFTYKTGTFPLIGMNNVFNLNDDPSYSKGQFIEFSEYYNMPAEFEIKPDFLLDQKDIYDYYVDGNEIYRFESKTIGKGSEDIKVEVKWIETYTEKNNIYSITVSRYDYQEFYEGPLEDEFGIERLDYKISKESKLIRFKIIPSTEPNQGWPEGTWELKGSYVEEELDTEYSFNQICKTLEEFPPDFILIPSKENIPSEYRVLDWTKTLNCQALITNNTEDWISNIEDEENRLMYFYNTIRILGRERPGYYIFLRSLLSGDTYVPSVSKLLYSFPSAETEEDTLQLYENLKNKKSNYLDSNNHFYYYDYYFPGESYKTTPLVRFVISKITRELEKNKWKIIGEKVDRIDENSIYSILQPIRDRFSIIRSIELNDFKIDGISRTVEASITTTLSDIISTDVSFDIILNYNKLNN